MACPVGDSRCAALLAHTTRQGSRIMRLCFGAACFNASLIRPWGVNQIGPSSEVWRGKWVEGTWLTPLFEDVLEGSCRADDGQLKMILDVGANVGLFSLFFLAHGCIVHAIEPLPLNADSLELSARLNGFTERLVLHRLAASQTARTVMIRTSLRATGYTHVVPEVEVSWPAANSSNKYVTGPTAKHNLQWSTLNVSAGRIDTVLTATYATPPARAAGERGRGAAPLPTWRGDPIPPRRVEWMKLDVEGWELEALCSASHLLRDSLVRAIGFELNVATTTRGQASRIGWLLHRHRLLPHRVAGVMPWSVGGFLTGRSRLETKAYMVVHTLARSETEYRAASLNATRHLSPAMGNHDTAALCANTGAVRAEETSFWQGRPPPPKPSKSASQGSIRKKASLAVVATAALTARPPAGWLEQWCREVVRLVGTLMGRTPDYTGCAISL